MLSSAGARCAGSQEYMGFLSKAWFTKANAGALRGYMRHLILQCFIEQVQRRSCLGGFHFVHPLSCLLDALLGTGGHHPFRYLP